MDTTLARRGLFAGALLATAAATGVPPTPPRTPIIEAGSQIAALATLIRRMDEELNYEGLDAATSEQASLEGVMADKRLSSIADAAIMLMKAASDTGSDSMRPDGVHDHEFGSTIVRRVMFFLADMAGIDLADYGAVFWLREDEAKVLSGSVEQAAQRLNGLTPSILQYRLARRGDDLAGRA